MWRGVVIATVLLLSTLTTQAAKRCKLGRKLCPDGTCILFLFECPDDCDKRCKNGKCIDKDRFCDEEQCPSHNENRCGDQCYADDERCNGEPICEDLSDEKDCSPPPKDNTPTKALASSGFLGMLAKWPWWVYVIGVGLFVLLCLIVGLCCRYQNKQSRARRMRRASQQRRRQQAATAASHPYSHEMPVVAGRRTQPVPTSRGHRGGSPQHAAYQAVPTQSSPASGRQYTLQAPYNPAVVPLAGQSTPAAYPAAAGPFGPHQAPGVLPSAPPIGMEAPPPYSEAIGGPPFTTPQAGPPGQPGVPYLPSYETVERSGR